MKLGSILAKVGSSIIKNVVPGGGLILDLVNGFLPDGMKLPENSTGEQVTQAVNSLPPAAQQELLLKEFDVEIAEINSWTQIQASLAEADKAGSSTRPRIALMMAEIVSFVVVAFASMWIVAIFRDQADMIEKLTNAWPLMLAIIATPTVLLRAYFGMRTKEKKERYRMVAGMGEEPASSIWGDIINAIKR